MKYNPDADFEPTAMTPYLDSRNRDFSKLTGVNRVHIPFIVCGDLSAFDSDTTYPLNVDGKNNYKYHNPIQSPIQPAYSFFNKKTPEELTIEIDNLPESTFDFDKGWEVLVKEQKFNFLPKNDDSIEKLYEPFQDSKYEESVFVPYYGKEDLYLLDNVELFELAYKVLRDKENVDASDIFEEENAKLLEENVQVKLAEENTDDKLAEETVEGKFARVRIVEDNATTVKEDNNETNTAEGRSEDYDMYKLEETYKDRFVLFDEIPSTSDPAFMDIKIKNMKATEKIDLSGVFEKCDRPNPRRIKIHEDTVKLHKLFVEAAKKDPSAIAKYEKTMLRTQGYLHLFGADKCTCCAPRIAD